MRKRELTGDYPKEAVDFEVGRIASDNLTISDGTDAPEPVPGESIDGIDQAEEAEV
jgi:hypothetical protein